MGRTTSRRVVLVVLVVLTGVLVGVPGIRTGGAAAVGGAASGRYDGGSPVPAPVPTGDPVQEQVLRVPASSGWLRQVRVYRPAGADRTDIPVVYFLHGQPGDSGELAANGVVDEYRDYLLAGGRPFVLVAPDGTGTRADTEWADALDGSDLVETGVVRDAIAAVEGPHRRPRALRAIAGFSMGGYGAMNLALRHPDLFGQVVTIAGYFRVDDPDEAFGGDPDAEAANSPDQHAAAGRDLRALLVEDTGDALPLVRGEAARMGGLLHAAGADVTVLRRPGSHDWDFVRSQLPDILTFLGRGWQGS